MASEPPLVSTPPLAELLAELDARTATLPELLADLERTALPLDDR